MRCRHICGISMGFVVGSLWPRRKLFEGRPDAVVAGGCEALQAQGRFGRILRRRRCWWTRRRWLLNDIEYFSTQTVDNPSRAVSAHGTAHHFCPASHKTGLRGHPNLERAVRSAFKSLRGRAPWQGLAWSRWRWAFAALLLWRQACSCCSVGPKRRYARCSTPC